jgi:hypothetical protein
MPLIQLKWAGFNMNDGEKMEFWNGLARLYDETLAIKEDILRLQVLAETHQNAARNLQTSCEALRDTALAHEKRLDRPEVVQQWLAEKERNRELGRQ